MAGPLYSFEMLQCLSLVFLEMLFRMFGFMWTPSLAVGFRVVTGKDRFSLLWVLKSPGQALFLEVQEAPPPGSDASKQTSFCSSFDSRSCPSSLNCFWWITPQRAWLCLMTALQAVESKALGNSKGTVVFFNPLISLVLWVGPGMLIVHNFLLNVNDH